MSFSYSTNEENYFGNYATREEALADALAGESGSTIYIGENIPPIQPEVFWHASDWLEHVSCQDDYYSDFADDWDYSTKEQRAELESEVRQVMAKWLDKHKLRPRHYMVTNITEHDKDGNLK